MGVMLSQLPPAEVARLKAELAETLIANFCYPRFFDYRTNSLRMRPVDRSKRQEVWLFLSSVDFNSWGRVDLMSPDFQRQVERLFIHFVQRNRSFFGEQGRKRMSDVRMLINSCAFLVVEGLRGHLTGRQPQGLPFGSPHPVVSWGTSIAKGHVEPNWERIASATMLLQQQLQELRGEVKSAGMSAMGGGHSTSVPFSVSVVQEVPNEVKPQPTPISEGRPTRPIVRRPHRDMPAPAAPRATNGRTSGVPPSTNASAAPSAWPPALPQTDARSSGTTPLTEPKSTTPLEPTWTATPPPATPMPTPVAPPPADITAVHKRNAGTAPSVAPSFVPSPASSSAQLEAPAQAGVPPHVVPNKMVSGKSPEGAPAISVSPQQQLSGQPGPVVATFLPPSSALPPVPTQQRELTHMPATGVTAHPHESTSVLVSEEDIAIFEEMRYQLLVWLRIEAVHTGIELSGQGPFQLLELLRQNRHIEETRLQVVSTLLNLISQVLKNGKASLLDYKQALMFHLMHTRSRH